MSRLGRRTPLDLLGVELGQVVWVYARHHWREARVVTKARSRVTVAYFVNHGGRLVRQDVPLRNLSLDKPIAHYANWIQWKGTAAQRRLNSPRASLTLSRSNFLAGSPHQSEESHGGTVARERTSACAYERRMTKGA